MKKLDYKIVFIVIIIALLFYLLGVRECPIYNIFHIPCPGCGLSRSFIYLIKGNIKNSFNYNILTIPLILFGLIYIIIALINYEKLNCFLLKYKKIIVFIAIILCIVSWIHNLLNSNLY